MKIKKQVPNWYIIADTKINTQTFSKFLEDNLSDFEINWTRNNGKAQSVSQIEKLSEVYSNYFLNIKDNMSNTDFHRKWNSTIIPILNHFSVSIVFKNVSSIFIKNLMRYKLDVIELDNKDLTPSCPNIYDDSNKHIFGQAIGDIFSTLEKVTVQSKLSNMNDIDIDYVTNGLKPKLQQSDILVTASLLNWKNILLDLTLDKIDAETRYIMIYLYKDLKMRYMGILSDIGLYINEKEYGIDTLNNDDIWKKCKLKKKCN